MTMTREAKARAQRDMVPQADGYTRVRFQSPRLVIAARANRGHDRMTASEYAAHRLGRGALNPTMIEDRRRRLAERRRAQRVLGGRRITG